MDALDLFFGFGIIVGFFGVLVPMLPGTIAVGLSIFLWAILVDEPTGWTVFAASTVVLLVGVVVKYAVPGKRLKDSGVPTSTLLAGGVLGIVGFFVVPVVGVVLGFVLGIYLAEWHRTSHQAAWPSTVSALKAVGLSIVIELTFAFIAAGVWLVGALTT